MIRTTALQKRFRTREGQEVQALDGVDLSVDRGEIFVLLGPSGSGKTTLLRCVAGIEQADAGEIALGDRVVFSGERKVSLPPEQRSIGMVFQSYAIWPHMTVEQNVQLPLIRGKRSIPKHLVRARVERALELVGLAGMASRPAPLLSGGQQQRVALARALAVEPEVLLMDEPLSNLDARLRQEVRSQIRDLAKQIGVTVLYVTHDQEEAMELGDRIAVMHLGRVIQTGSAEELYGHPADPLVAQFFGQINWLDGIVEVSGRIHTSLGVLTAPGSGFSAGTEVRVGIRPEDVELCSVSSVAGTGADANAANALPGRVVAQAFLGTHRMYRVQVGAETLLVSRSARERLEGEVEVRLLPERLQCFARPGAGAADGLSPAAVPVPA